jgi:cyclophilin family peptidyl-prolyl cis-trans isomerase
MPKTTKRAAAKRAARIERAHATELKNREVKDPNERQRSPGYKAPARGIARYPWAAIILLCLILGGVGYGLYAAHLPPFAVAAKPVATKPAASKSAATPVANATSAVSTPTAQPANAQQAANSTSPCTAANIVSAVTQTSPIPSAADVAKINHTYGGAKQVIDENKLYCAGINTNRGLIVVELDPKLAPKTVNNFVFLVENHFYDGLKFHRVIPDTAANAGNIHIAQGGDPKGDGTGGPGYQFADEPVKGDYTAGTLAMANSGANTNGSQFFINITDNKQLPKSYNLFGHVVQGMNVVQALRGPSEVDKTTAPDIMYYVRVVPAS